MPRPRLLLPPLLALACDPRPTAAPVDQPAAPPSPAATPTEPTPAEPPPAPATPAPASDPLAAPTFAPGPFEVRLGNGKPIAPSRAFKHVPGPDMQDHAWAFGWTADGSAFAHCTVVSGEDCKHCTYTSLDGTREQLRSGKVCKEKGVTMIPHKDLKQRLVDRGVEVRDGEWPHGAALVVTAREATGAPDSDGEPRATLKVGTARRDGAAEADAYDEAGCIKEKGGATSCFTTVHAEAILLSPDATHVAILGHLWEGEWSDTFTLDLVPAGRLAAATYNQQGLAALARNDLPAAADAFLAAMHADPAAWKGPYNLACAHARAADPRARPALQAALDRAPDAVRKRAAADRDLDSVRTQPWFTAMMAPR